MKKNQRIDAVLAAQQNADELKAAERAAALLYAQQIIAVFDFRVSELFPAQRDNFRNGTMNICRDLFDRYPDISTAEFIAKAAKQGVKHTTARVAYGRLKNHTL